MIEYDKRTESIIKNIYENVSIILSDFERNREVHYDYIIEKLSSAQWDINVLLNIAERKKEEVENSE